MKATNFPALIQRFFTDRLCTQMEASQHTIAGYRDTFRLLIRYAGSRCGKPPTKLTIEDLDADLVADFLSHVETTRGNTARTRNARLGCDPFILPIRRDDRSDLASPLPAHSLDAKQAIREA